MSSSIDAQLMSKIRSWAKDRSEIMDREEMSGSWSDEIQGSDDDAAELLHKIIAGQTCPTCEPDGVLADQGYGFTGDDLPDGWFPVQRCDGCQLYDSDEAAAALMEHYQQYGYGYSAMMFRKPECPCGRGCTMDEPGDWFVWTLWNTSIRWPADFPAPSPEDPHVFWGRFTKAWVFTHQAVWHYQLSPMLSWAGSWIRRHGHE